MAGRNPGGARASAVPPLHRRVRRPSITSFTPTISGSTNRLAARWSRYSGASRYWFQWMSATHVSCEVFGDDQWEKDLLPPGYDVVLYTLRIRWAVSELDDTTGLSANHDAAYLSPESQYQAYVDSTPGPRCGPLGRCGRGLPPVQVARAGYAPGGAADLGSALEDDPNVRLRDVLLAGRGRPRDHLLGASP